MYINKNIIELPSSIAEDTNVTYIHDWQIPRVDLEILMNEFLGLSNNLELLQVIRAKKTVETHQFQPEQSKFINFDNVKNANRRNISATNTTPENWFHFQYNQHFDIPAYFLRNAQIKGGGFTQPVYQPYSIFMGRRLGTHTGGAFLQLNDGAIFRYSFSYQDSHISLPSEFFSVTSSGSLQASKQASKQASFHEITEPCYFLGNVLPHFGHFILDGMSRLWLLNKIPYEFRKNMKFVLYNNNLPPWALALLAPFGINTSNIIYTNKHLRFKRLIVPGDSYQTHIRGRSEFQSIFDIVKKYYAPYTQPSKNIYLSRKAQSARQMQDEEHLENIMREMGFEIIAPETLSIAEQVKLAASASILAGATGSSMYLAGFQATGTKTLVFSPSNFLLFDDFSLAAIARRKICFVLGNAHIPKDENNKRKSSWKLNLNDNSLIQIRDFIYQT